MVRLFAVTYTVRPDFTAADEANAIRRIYAQVNTFLEERKVTDAKIGELCWQKTPAGSMVVKIKVTTT